MSGASDAIGGAAARPDRYRVVGLRHLAGPLQDTAAMTWRNLVTLRRVPRLLVFSFVQPVVFVLLFRYVFAGAVTAAIPGVAYVDFLMPGVFVQVVVFGALNTAVGLASDHDSGLLERLRSLPMSRVAVLAGRTGADLVRNVFVLTLMVGVGFAIGFRIHRGAGLFVAGMTLVLLFGFAMTWVYAVLGLVVGDAETAMAAGFPILAPLVFASSAFVPVDTMPGWLQGFAANQPVSQTASAVRACVLGGPIATYAWHSVAWSVGIVLVFAPLGAWVYHRRP